MDTVLRGFMRGAQDAASGAQIVALGAGSDTTFFRMRKAGTLPSKYVEVDLRDVVMKKFKIIYENADVRDELGLEQEQLKTMLEKLKTNPNEPVVLIGPHYCLADVDITKVDDLEGLLKRIPGLDFSLPTIFVSECVLCYVEPRFSDGLLKWIVETFPNAAFTSYEQILPEDAFGKTMLGHFEARGCPLKSIETYPDVERQEKRYKAQGWSQVEVLDMNDVYYKCLDKETLTKAEKLEIFDEFEEWHLMSAHYCLALVMRMRDIPQEKVFRLLRTD